MKRFIMMLSIVLAVCTGSLTARAGGHGFYGGGHGYYGGYHGYYGYHGCGYGWYGYPYFSIGFSFPSYSYSYPYPYPYPYYPYAPGGYYYVQPPPAQPAQPAQPTQPAPSATPSSVSGSVQTVKTSSATSTYVVSSSQPVQRAPAHGTVIEYWSEKSGIEAAIKSKALALSRSAPPPQTDVVSK